VLIGMTNAAAEPHTLIEAIRYFADPDIALRTMIDLRWPAGVCCPTFGSIEARFGMIPIGHCFKYIITL